MPGHGVSFGKRTILEMEIGDGISNGWRKRRCVRMLRVGEEVFFLRRLTWMTLRHRR